MRQKIDPQGYFSWAEESTGKVVWEYEEKYRRIGDTLDANPEILDLVDRDLRKLSRPSKRGRDATYTSEIILRVMIVHHLEGRSLRSTEVLLAHSIFLQSFVKLGNRPPLSYSFIDRCLNAIRPETWAKVNEVLTRCAHEQGRIEPSQIRVDTTVVESNIHYPTDSSLLWDSYRTLYRLLDQARSQVPGILPNRFHKRKVKKLHLYITRYITSRDKKRQRKVKKAEVKLIGQVERIHDIAKGFIEGIWNVPDVALYVIALEIKKYLSVIRIVIEVAKRVWIRAETVPASDRVFSLFEPHTELIKRGRHHKPIEFGHMIWLGQTRQKFITQYQVMETKIPDSQLSERIVDEHVAVFGEPPETLAADKGFRGNPDFMQALQERVKVVAIPRRLKDFADDAFVKLQHWRAGIEGSISFLKRTLGLSRCPYRGFKNFASHVGRGVFCHNLVNLATTSA